MIALLSGAAVALYTVLGAQLSFFNDDWYFLFQRPGFESRPGLDSILAPHNGNLVALPDLAYKLLVTLFGYSQLPYRLLLGLAIGTLGLLVYVLVSRRAGAAWGLAAAAVVMFLGPAWEDLLFFASIDLVGSLVAGLGALLALEHDSPGRRAVACLLLVVAVACSNLGIAFGAAALVCILLRGRPGQLWIPLVPLVLFSVWWLADGHSQPSHLSSGNLEHLPRYVLNSAESGLASLAGVSAGTHFNTYSRGKIVGIVVFVGLVVWLLRGGRPRLSILVPITALLVFWLLTGASFYAGRQPVASRYQLIDVTLIFLIAAQLPSSPPRYPAWNVLAVAVGVAVVALNITGQLSVGYRFMSDQAGYVKTDLGVLQAIRSHLPPALQLTDQIAANPYLSGINGKRYLAETAAHGVPATSLVSRILGASPGQRRSADGVLAAAEGLRPTVPPTPLPGHGCVLVGNQPGDSRSEIVLMPGTIRLEDPGAGPLVVAARRFAPVGLLSDIGLIGAGASEQLHVPADALPLKWRLAPLGRAATSPASLRICRSA